MQTQFFNFIDSWPDFVTHLSVFNNKQKGDAFETLVFHFLQLHPVYATQLETVWLLQNVPADVSKKLNLPASDEGIDLIARTMEGGYWAIQCKYREDMDHSLTRRELATFTDLAFGVCKGIELALVCTTADRFSHKLTLHGERLTFLAGDVWRNLDDTFFEALRCHIAHRPTPIKPLFPRPHQQKALDEAILYFLNEGNERGKLIMPCGSGKSLTGWWLAEKLQTESVLVAVPSLSLVKQTLEVWARESVACKMNMRWIAVCSDESVAKTENDDAAVLVQDLGVRVHTDPREIADWLKHSFDGVTVVFTTYQSGRAIAEAARIAAFDFDLGILDEAHKTVGKKGSLFDHLLHEQNISIHRRVFMTATERRYRGDSDNILSMDDPQSYGETFHLLSFKSALECDPPILSDYKIITVAVTRSEIAALVRANLLVRPDKGVWNDDLEAEMLASLISLRKAMQKYPIRHAVSFHASIARASAFKDSQDVLTAAFPEFGSLDTFHVTGKTPTGKRKRVLDAFATAERSLVTNARCLTEGVDVPGIDCVLFADPKRSTVDIVQAVGRALRPAPGKVLGYVVIPVLVDDLGVPEQTPFDSVLMVLRALAANDERIVEYFRTVSLGRQYGGHLPVEFAVPDGVEISADEFVNAIELKAWSRLAKLSWRPFEEAREFVHGVGLNSKNEWVLYCKGQLPEKGTLPVDIPGSPRVIYNDSGWCGFGDWLGTGAIAPQLMQYRTFEEAREFVRKLCLRNQKEWTVFCKGQLPEKGLLPEDIPASPEKTYKNKGWLGIGDWIGTGAIAPSKMVYRDFEDARAFAHSLELKGVDEWRDFCRGKLPHKGTLPKDMSASPDKTYKNRGWLGFGDWLGTGNIANFLKVYRPFYEARAYARSLAFKGQKEWYAFCKGELPEKSMLPEDIPRSPQKTYKDRGWQGFGDWLGTGNIASSKMIYSEFEEARIFARGLKLKSGSEWRDFCRGKLPEKGVLPFDIPANPSGTYKNEGWQSMGDWLGTGTVAAHLRVYRQFQEAREFARNLKLKSWEEWQSFCRGKLPEKGILPPDISASPEKTYKNEGWQNWGDWLGTGNIAHHLRVFRPFTQAREFARSLKLKGQKEWNDFCSGKIAGKGKLPEDIPSNPSKTYKDCGWQGTHDWLGPENVAENRRTYRSFEEARDYVRSLFIKSQSEWRSLYAGKIPEKGTLPKDIPSHPEVNYKDQGWLGYRDWLGTG